MKENTLEIKIGKGKLLIGSNVLEIMNEGTLSVTLLEDKGPCNDVSCQLIQKIQVQEGREKSGRDMIDLEVDGRRLSLERRIFTSIDRGRQTVSVRMGRSGKFSVKGFTYVS